MTTRPTPDPDEVLVDPREHYVHDTATCVAHSRQNPHYRHLQPGDVVSHDVAAPGTGRITYRVTYVDARGAWGHVIASTVRDLTAGEVR